MVKKRLSKNLDRHAGGKAVADLPVPPRVQRKLAKKARFMDRVAKSKASALSSVRQRVMKKGGQRPSLSLADLADSLPEVRTTAPAEATKSSQPGRGVNRRRAKTLVSETARLQVVLQHPQYQADPFAAVASHLDATLPPAPVPPKKQPTAQSKRDKRRRKKLRATMDES